MRKKIFTFLLALVASVGMSWAGEVTIVFAANNNTKEVTVELPHTFWCSNSKENGELDLIIQELYGLSMGGFCDDDFAPTATGNAAVTAGKAGTKGKDHYITISDVFAGTATVAGSYYEWYQPIDEETPGVREKEYSLTISIKNYAPANSCGDGLTWELKDGALTISYDGEGTGVMNDFEQGSSPWKDQIASITSVVINEGAKNIGKHAFYECEYITTVTLANSVETIGEGAFRNCEDLASLELGNNIKTIEQEAFITCSALKTVTIGTGITSIGTGAFYGCEELTTVTCSATTPPILGMAVFASCPKLTQIFVPTESVDAYKTAWSNYESIIEAIGGGSTPTLKLIEFQVPASWENDNSPISIADFPDFVATTYEIASALPVTSEPALVVFDFPGDDEVSVYSKMGGKVSDPSTGAIKRETFFENTQVHYYYPVLAGDDPQPTGVENVQTNQVQATKFFRDGQLLIEKNGKIYNVMGAEVK